MGIDPINHYVTKLEANKEPYTFYPVLKFAKQSGQIELYNRVSAILNRLSRKRTYVSEWTKNERKRFNRPLVYSRPTEIFQWDATKDCLLTMAGPAAKWQRRLTVRLDTNTDTNEFISIGGSPNRILNICYNRCDSELNNDAGFLSVASDWRKCLPTWSDNKRDPNNNIKNFMDNIGDRKLFIHLDGEATLKACVVGLAGTIKKLAESSYKFEYAIGLNIVKSCRFHRELKTFQDAKDLLYANKDLKYFLDNGLIELVSTDFENLPTRRARMAYIYFKGKAGVLNPEVIQ